jgi:hypothetical protein
MSLRLEVDSQGADQKELNHCRKKNWAPTQMFANGRFIPMIQGRNGRKRAISSRAGALWCVVGELNFRLQTS